MIVRTVEGVSQDENHAVHLHAVGAFQVALHCVSIHV